MIIQNEPISADQKADLSFTIATDDLRGATDVLEPLDVAERIETDPQVGKVSIVGAGMRSHPGVAAKVFATLGERGINIEMISTSPIKISCVIAAERVPEAVKAIHEAIRPRRRRGSRGGPLGRAPPAGHLLAAARRNASPY